MDDKIMKVKCTDEVMEALEEEERLHPNNSVINITQEVKVRCANETELYKLCDNNLKLLQKTNGSKLKIYLNNPYDAHTIDTISIKPYGKDYSYVIHTREYGEDYTYDSIGTLDEVLEMLMLTCYYGKNLKFITDYSYKKEVMVEYAKTLMDADISVELEAESITLTQPITMDTFILCIVPRLVFLRRGEDSFIITDISYQFNVHPKGVIFIQANADEDSDGILVEIATINLGIFSLVRKSMNVEEALEVWWTVLIKESIPNDLDTWEEVTYKGGVKGEE